MTPASRLNKESTMSQTTEWMDAFTGAINSLRRAAERSHETLAPLIHSLNVDSGQDPPTESLADFLLARDWPTTPITPSRRLEYRRRAAAILQGDPKAIREAWPLV